MDLVLDCNEFYALQVFLIQGVHKASAHFKRIIILIVFAIEIICKKDLKEENQYFLRFFEILFKFSHVLHHLQYKK